MEGHPRIGTSEIAMNQDATPITSVSGLINMWIAWILC